MNQSTQKDSPRVEPFWKGFVPEICTLIIIVLTILTFFINWHDATRKEAVVKNTPLVIPVVVNKDGHEKFTLIKVDREIAEAIISTVEGRRIVASYTDTMYYIDTFPGGLGVLASMKEMSADKRRLVYFVEKRPADYYTAGEGYVPTDSVYLVLSNHSFVSSYYHR